MQIGILSFESIYVYTVDRYMDIYIYIYERKCMQIITAFGIYIFLDVIK